MSEVTKAKFDKAVQIVQSFPKDGPVQPSINDKLFFYSHYKQATIGDITDAKISKPNILFDPSGNAKWGAWKSVEGTSAEVCYQKYVEKLIELLKKAGDSESLKQVEEIETA